MARCCISTSINPNTGKSLYSHTHHYTEKIKLYILLHLLPVLLLFELQVEVMNSCRNRGGD